MTIVRNNAGKIVRLVLYIVTAASLLFIFRFYDPGSEVNFPECPFRKVTGLLCPGCGSQRAAHDLLHLNISTAIRHNTLMVLSIPYLLLGFAFDLFTITDDRFLKMRKRLYGKKAIYLVLSIIFIFWIIRNVIAFRI